MKVSLVQEECIGCGVCCQVCPDVYGLDEAAGVSQLDLIIVLLDRGGQLRFLDVGDFLVLFRLGALFLKFVFELPVVQNLADRRRDARRDFDEVEAGLFRENQRLFYRHDADVLAFRTDQADFPDGDFLIDPGAVFRRRSR